MESRNIALVPFTVDHLCGIGSMAHQLLFHEQQAPFPAPLPTPVRSLSRCTLAATHQRARDLKLGILSLASHYWQSDSPVGSTWHSRSPTQWALQTLSVNITRAYAKHLEFTLNRCTQAHLMTETDALPHIEGGHNIPFNYNPMVSAARDSTVVVV